MEDNHKTPTGGEETREPEAATPLVEYRRRKAEMLTKHPERREFSTTDFELRETPNGILRFGGYASVTETPYEVGFYTETIKRGAFKRTLSESPDVQLLINHGDGGSGMPIARTGRNMTLTEDDNGLRVDADLDAEDPDVQLLARKMKNGLIDQMSFAFQATDQEWNDDYTERSIKAASIHRGDVSVVNQGANGASMAVMRSREVVKTIEKRGLDGFLAMVDAFRADKGLSDEAREAFLDYAALSAGAGVDDPELRTLISEYLGVPETAETEDSAEGAASEAEETPANRALSALERQDQFRRSQDQRKRANALRRAK